jgi:branched-chain amino acid transport system ATP-binding protein
MEFRRDDAMTVLQTIGLTKLFGGLSAVDKLDLTINEGEIFGLIGPNGSGKTTALNLITGFIKPTSGSVRYLGEDITGLQTHSIAGRGLIRTFQITSLFEDLTVLENILHAAHLYNSTSLFGALVSSKSNQRKTVELEAKAIDILQFVGLGHRLESKARDLSAGSHRYLEIGIALSARPKVLLLDEPATGLNSEEASRLMDLIRTLHDRGTTVVLVEHNMKLVMNICTRILVLKFGAAIAEGTPEEIVNNETVVSAYLGRRRGA